MLCVDEKSQIQALDRSQPMFPMRPSQAVRRSHEYKNNALPVESRRDGEQWCPLEVACYAKSILVLQLGAAGGNNLFGAQMPISTPGQFRGPKWIAASGASVRKSK